MTQPFQYNNFVQSQIAVGPGNIPTSYGAQPQSNNYLETSNGNQSRLSLKQKINELLGLCKEENQGIKTQFVRVMGAEQEILDLMKQQLQQPPRFNNYARSNVEMFPGTQQAATNAPYVPGAGYEEQNKPRSHQSFPAYKSSYQGGQNIPPQQYGNRASYQQYEPAETAGVYKGYGQPQGQNQGQGIFPSQQYIQPGSFIGNLSQQNVRQQPGYSNEDPYAVDGNLYPQGNEGFGYASNLYPNDRTNILKSKVHELKQENNRLRGLASQVQAPRDDDEETRYLQQQIARLRAVVQDYEYQLNALNSSPKADKRAFLLRQLKDQGQKIRQDTIALLRNKSTPNAGLANNNTLGSYGSYGSNGGSYGAQMVSSGYRGNEAINPDQHAQLRAQLNDLRAECQQLQSENANIKRLSKGTNLTSGSRRF